MAAIDTPIGAGARRRARPTVVLGTLVVFALAVVAGYVGYTRITAAPEAPAVNGTPAVARRGTVSATVATTGSVVTGRQSKLAPQVSGRLQDVPVKIGDAVKTGAVLAKVDAVPLELKVAQAQSSLRTAQIKLEQLKTGSRPEDVAQAEAAVRTSQAKLADIQAGATAQDIAQAQSAIDSAAANVRAAESKLAQVKQGPAAADVASAEQAVTNAKASLAKAQIALDQTSAGSKPEDIRQQELAVEQAKNSLWSQQISRDATCGRGKGPTCDSANASVASAESNVTQAAEKLNALKNPPDPKDVAAKQADVDQAREALRAAQVKLDQVKAGPTTDDVRQAESPLQSAQANYQSAVAKLDLLKQGSKPADVEAARNALIQAEQQLAVKKAPNTAQDVQLAEEQVKQAEISLKQARLDLENATLTAPFDGVVSTIGANVGEQVGSGTQLITLIDPSQTRVDATIDESDIAKIAPGQTAQVTFDALPNQNLTGKVIGVAPSATITQGVATYAVSILLDKTDHTIPIGLTANVNVVTAQKDNVVVVPIRAVKRQGRTQEVDVLVDGKTETRPVTTGLANDQVIEVVSGLSDGESVVIPATTATQPRIGGIPGGGGPGPGPGVVVRR